MMPHMCVHYILQKVDCNTCAASHKKNFTPISKTFTRNCSVNYCSSAASVYTILMDCAATYELRDFQVMVP